MRITTLIAIAVTVLALALALVLPGSKQAEGGDGGARAPREWCTGCHVVAVDGGGSDGAPPFTLIANRADATPERLRAFLTAPHGRMPDFQLSRPYITDIVDYIWSLRDR